MALERTLLSFSTCSNIFLRVPGNPISNFRGPALSPTHFPFYPRADTERFSFIRNLRCSVHFRDNHFNQVVEYAKPAEIPWNKELCNAVHLIGIVGTPVEIKHLPSGKVLAWTRLAVRKSATETTW